HDDRGGGGEDRPRPAGHGGGGGVIPGVEQRQAAARLAGGKLHGHVEAAQQAHDPLADLGIEHVRQAGDHQAHADRRAHACGGGGETSTSTSRRSPESLRTPWAKPAGATTASPASSVSSSAPTVMRPRSSSTT